MTKPKNKTFDCVEFKRQAQARIRAEWEARKDEFSSYAEFLRVKVNESDWQRAFWARIEAAEKARQGGAT